MKKILVLIIIAATSSAYAGFRKDFKAFRRPLTVLNIYEDGPTIEISKFNTNFGSGSCVVIGRTSASPGGGDQAGSIPADIYAFPLNLQVGPLDNNGEINKNFVDLESTYVSGVSYIGGYGRSNCIEGANIVLRDLNRLNVVYEAPLVFHLHVSAQNKTYTDRKANNKCLLHVSYEASHKRMGVTALHPLELLKNRERLEVEVKKACHLLSDQEIRSELISLDILNY